MLIFFCFKKVVQIWESLFLVSLNVKERKISNLSFHLQFHLKPTRGENTKENTQNFSLSSKVILRHHVSCLFLEWLIFILLAKYFEVTKEKIDHITVFKKRINVCSNFSIIVNFTLLVSEQVSPKRPLVVSFGSQDFVLQFVVNQICYEQILVLLYPSLIHLVTLANSATNNKNQSVILLSTIFSVIFLKDD